VAQHLKKETAITGLRERKRADSVAATVDCAFALFVERGYDNVTVADICEAASIGRRTFFRYFASKEDVLMEPIRAMAARVTTSVASAPASKSDARVIREALTELAEDALQHRERLVDLAKVLPEARNVHMSSFAVLSDQEARLAGELAARRGEAEPDWRTRLLVARANAALRVWLDDLAAGRTTDPRAHLDEVFNYR
jgi:AcrR family transcriptional regulator